MERAKRKLLEQTHQTIMEVGLESSNPELLINLASPNIVAFGSTTDENIFGIDDLKALLKKQKAQSLGIEIKWKLNNLSSHISKDENNALFVDEVNLNIKTEEDSIEMLLRFSLVLEYVENKWIMVHFHTSKPEQVENEEDTFGIETWKAKATELEKEVALRTADLVLKNRDLSIENALERVRARSMAMQSSDELEVIIQVVYDQFVELGITLDHAGFIIDFNTNDDMLIWLADAHKVTPQIRLSYFDSPHWNSYVEAKDKGPKLFVNHLNFKVKNKFYKEIFKQVPALPEDAKDYYLKIPSLTIATVLIDTIGLYIENFSGVQYDDEDQKVL
ncbi:MAG: nuclear transport factor 2 family protein, partial [Winogradskyella sp.]|nr:nuclear transport factor 2 family protein [Winogradskyella sp.]